MNDLIVVEFSISQKAFHKHSVSEMLIRNNQNIIRRQQTDYIPIGIFKTNELANAFIDKIRHIIEDYTLYKSSVGETLLPAN